MAKFKLNPLTGFFDIVSSGGSGPATDSFSYEYVSGSTTIPVEQQMCVDGAVMVSGLLDVQGSLAVVSDDQGFGFPETILSSETYSVPVRRQVILSGVLDNQGLLETYGALVIQ